MKNILARGGIEFIAVLLGLSGSLWIDSNIKEKEAREQNEEVLTRLYHNLRADSSDGEWNRKAYERGIRGSKNVIKWCESNPTFAMVDDSIEKDISAMLIATFFGNNAEEYNSLKNSGKIELIQNKEIITKLHRYYSSLEWLEFMDSHSWKLSNENILPFLINYSNDYQYHRTEPAKSINKVYGNYPKINLIRLPETEKLRFYASTKLDHQTHQNFLYERVVERVTELRQLLREELGM